MEVWVVRFDISKNMSIWLKSNKKTWNRRIDCFSCLFYCMFEVLSYIFVSRNHSKLCSKVTTPANFVSSIFRIKFLTTYWMCIGYLTNWFIISNLFFLNKQLLVEFKTLTNLQFSVLYYMDYLNTYRTLFLVW